MQSEDRRAPSDDSPLHLPTARTMAEECGWTLAEFAAFYATSARKELHAVTAAARANDFEALLRLAHGAKGASASCGAVGVAPLYAEVEDAARKEQAEPLPDLLRCLDDAVEEVVAAFEDAVA